MKLLLSAFSCKPNEGGELGNGFNCAYYNAKQGIETYCITRDAHQEAITAANDLSNLHFIFVPVPIPHWMHKQIGEQGFYMMWQYLAAKKAKELDMEVNFDVA